MTFSRRSRSTPWVPYTPIFSTLNNNGSIGNGTIQGRWKRSEDSVHLVIRMLWGSTTAGGTGEFRFSMPVGLTADFSKTPSFFFLNRNFVYLIDSSTPSNNRSGFLQVSQLIRILPNETGAASSTVPFTWATSDVINIDTTVPIVQFS